jgi:serine protease AprX
MPSPTNTPDPEKRFDPANLIKTVIAVPLMKDIDEDENSARAVIIDVNIRYRHGRKGAKEWVSDWVNKALEQYGDVHVQQGISQKKSERSQQYVYARLQGKVIRGLVEQDQTKAIEDRAIYHVWPDFVIKPLIWKSVPTRQTLASALLPLSGREFSGLYSIPALSNILISQSTRT